MKKSGIVVSILLIFTMSFCNANAQQVIYINTKDVQLINDNCLYLTGSIDYNHDIRDYGFAISDFPLPPIKGQKVDYYKIEGKPLKNGAFSYMLNDLEAGKHYFIAAYYRSGTQYYYADTHTASTPRSIKLIVETVNTTVSEDLIEVPLIFQRVNDVLIGDISVSYDSSKLEFVELDDQFSSTLASYSLTSKQRQNKDILNFRWCSKQLISLADVSLTFKFKLTKNIEESNFTSIDIVNAQFYNENGQELSVETVDGLINYQYKNEKQNVVDKIFNDSDIVSLTKKIETSESVTIEHISQVNNVRWLQAKNYFNKNRTPININQKYLSSYLSQTENKPIYEKMQFNFLNNQVRDLKKTGCGLRFQTPYKLTLYFTSESLQELKGGKVEISKLNKEQIENHVSINEKVFSSWQLNLNLNQTIEIRFPVSDGISEKKLRIRSINDLNQQKEIIPYYINDAAGSRYACITTKPNAKFILYQPDSKTLIANVDSNKYKIDQDIIMLEGAPLVTNGSQIILPLEAISKCFNITVKYLPNSNKIILNDGREILLSIDGKVVLINHQAKLLDKSPTVINGQVYIDQSFLKKILGVYYSYNPRTKQIKIIY